MTATPSRVRQIVGGVLLASTIGTGLAFASTATANAAPTQYEAYRDCVTNRGSGSELECCWRANGGVINDKKGNFVACDVSTTRPVPTTKGSTPASKPELPGNATQVPGRNSLGY